MPFPSDLPHELPSIHVGLLVALEGLRRARESLGDHVCDPSPQGCALCKLARSLTAATLRAARAVDAVETGSATLVDGDAVDDALVCVQEMLDGQRPPHLAGVGGGPQRAGNDLLPQTALRVAGSGRDVLWRSRTPPHRILSSDAGVLRSCLV